MRQELLAMLASIALVAPLSGAQAQQEEGHRCAAGPAEPTAELAGWTRRSPLAAARDAAGLANAALRVGSAVEATLHFTSDVRYLRQPGKPGGSMSYGGLFNLTIERGGAYRVALGSAAWVDVLKGMQAATSIAHGHGPECSGIRKVVDFRLTPGRHTLQIAANGAPTLQLMVVRLP